MVEGNKIIRSGKNVITYTAKDNNGNTTVITREITVKPNTDYDSPGVGICMYHYVYDENDPPADLHQRYGNYISMKDLEEELNWDIPPVRHPCSGKMQSACNMFHDNCKQWGI